jgi:hypothetical protein
MANPEKRVKRVMQKTGKILKKVNGVGGDAQDKRIDRFSRHSAAWKRYRAA